MSEKILELVRSIFGSEETDEVLLQMLCKTEETYWKNRLLVAPETCEDAFCCAAALTTAANLMASERENVSSFAVGELSVKLQDGIACAVKETQLRQTAERIMAPYTRAEDFCFKGVRG